MSWQKSVKLNIDLGFIFAVIALPIAVYKVTGSGWWALVATAFMVGIAPGDK